jgi:hypothetical protein
MSSLNGFRAGILAHREGENFQVREELADEGRIIHPSSFHLHPYQFAEGEGVELS